MDIEREWLLLLIILYDREVLSRQIQYLITSKHFRQRERSIHRITQELKTVISQAY